MPRRLIATSVSGASVACRIFRIIYKCIAVYVSKALVLDGGPIVILAHAPCSRAMLQLARKA